MFSRQSLAHNLNVDLEQNDQGLHFLLMDGSLNHDLIPQYFELDEDPEYQPLFLGNDELLALSPYIIQVKSSTQPFLDWYTHHASLWGFLYYSTHSLDEQFEYWLSLLEVLTPYGDEMLLRFSDGKIALSLWNQFSEAQRLSFFQPCKTLHFQLPNQEWVRRELNTPNEPLIFDSTKPWFVLNDRLVDGLTSGDAILVEKLLNRLWEYYPDKLEKLPESTIGNMIHQGLEQARVLDISSEKQLSLFVFLMFEYAPNLMEDRQVKSIFQREYKTQPIEFGSRALDQMLRVFSNQDWERIKANSNLVI